MGSRDLEAKETCIDYLQMNFKLFKKEKQEGSKYYEEENSMN